MTVAVEASREHVEALIGRPLRPSELIMDVVRLDRALNRAKDELEQAVRAEMLFAFRRWLRSGRVWRPHMRMTQAMEKPVRELRRLGREEARAELARLGRTFAARDPNPRATDPFDEVLRTIADSLPGLALRMHDDLVDVDLTDASTSAIVRALLRVPGARDLASRVVSTALMSGMSQTFEEADASGLVGAWERSAILDGGTCPPCEAADGETFPSWAAAQLSMPNGGPAVNCQGGGRCRCRLVPVA